MTLSKEPYLSRALLHKSSIYVGFFWTPAEFASWLGLSRASGNPAGFQNPAHCNNTLQQHTATHCNTLQNTVTHCDMLQRTATHCDTLQRAHILLLDLSPSRRPRPLNLRSHAMTWIPRNIISLVSLQLTAPNCNALQQTATHCNAL